MKASDRKVLFSSDRKDWRTPPAVVDPLVRLALTRPTKRWIGLDPCGGPGTLVPAKRMVVLPVDGLSISWRGYGLTFVNPPYGDDEERGTGIDAWTAKGRVQFGAQPAEDELVQLLPARTDARFWQRDVAAASAWCLIRGRVLFHLPTGGPAPHGAPFPSALTYYGRRVEAFADLFTHLGQIVILQRPSPRVVPRATVG